MTDDRSRIFSAIQAALAGRAQRAAYPEWDDALAVAAGVPDGVDSKAGFRSRFEEAGGQCFDGVETLIEHLARRGVRVGYCDPALGPAVWQALAGRFEIRDRVDRGDIDSLDFAVSRARLGVAETGSLLLSDAETPDRLAAVAPWIHVAVLDPADLVATLGEAIAGEVQSPYSVFVTGPSQTADVEGILIRGVHGPGEQLCLLLGSGSGGAVAARSTGFD